MSYFFLFSQLQSLSLPSHWITQFFQAHVAIDLQSYEEGLERYSNLSQAGFSENKYILLQTALAQYHARGVVLSIQYNNRVCPNSCISLSKAWKTPWNFFSTCSLKTPNSKWNIIVVYPVNTKELSRTCLKVSVKLKYKYKYKKWSNSRKNSQNKG